MSQVGTWTFEILLNHGFELLECTGLDVKLPFETGAHLAFHPVNPLKGKHILTNNTPGLVGVSIITDNLGIMNAETKRGGQSGDPYGISITPTIKCPIRGKK